MIFRGEDVADSDSRTDDAVQLGVRQERTTCSVHSLHQFTVKTI